MNYHAHLVPIAEFGLHEATLECPCEPDVQWTHPQTGQILDEPIVIHPPFAALPIVAEAEKLIAASAGIKHPNTQ